MSVLAKSDTDTERSRALASLSAMREAGLRPDRVSYNAALSAVGSDVARARQLTEEMVGEGVTPDAVTLCALLTVCDRAGDWASAWGAFEGMEASVRVDAAVFNALISACARGGRWGGTLPASSAPAPCTRRVRCADDLLFAGLRETPGDEEESSGLVGATARLDRGWGGLDTPCRSPNCAATVPVLKRRVWTGYLVHRAARRAGGLRADGGYARAADGGDVQRAA